MTLRTMVLRSMLCFLLLAALGGITSVFIPTEFAPPIIETSAMIALVSALFVPVLPRREGYTVLLSGKVWMTVVLLIALGWIVIIWDRVLANLINVESIVVSQSILLLGMIVALIPLKLLEHSQVKFRTVAKASLLITGGTSVLMIGALLVRGGISNNLFGEWTVLILGGLAAVSCATGWVARRAGSSGILPLFGIVVTVICVGFWQPVIFEPQTGNVPLWIFGYALLLTGIAVGIAIHSIAKPLPLGRIERRLIPAITIAAMFMGLLSFMMARRTEFGWVNDLHVDRLLVALAIVEGCLILTVIALWQLGRRSVRPWTVCGAELACPRCGKRAIFATGESPCSTCGFVVLIAFRDVCCAKCKHDVRTLEPTHPCPECGHEVERSSERYFTAGAGGSTGAVATPSD
ncbi:MAG: hypothetical protein EXS17_06250 [Phycisphaerales bacterium]|nr:hypothetical protein [Phycisphaerales bacterium]